MFRAWLEIDLEAVAHNLLAVRRIVGAGVGICAVVKADAYGHGAVECAKVLLQNGADSLGVATCDEGIELQKNGINGKIAVLAHSPTDRFPEIIDASLSQTLSSLEAAKELSNAASNKKQTAAVHIKIDTGMRRIGFEPTTESIKKIMEISRLPFISIEGVSSHFAMGENPDNSFTYEQHKRYMFVVNALKEKGLSFSTHICNSGGVVNYPAMHMDFVRPGAILYGLKIFEDDVGIGLKPAMTLKAQICHIAQIKAGESVGYDRTFVAKRDTVVGTIVIGYADGYVSSLSNKSRIIAGKKYAPVLGRVCMDQMMVDLTDIDGIKEGSEVTLLGKKGDLEITANELADLGNVKIREVVCMLGNAKRVPRVYL